MAIRYLNNFLASESFKMAYRDITHVTPRVAKLFCSIKLTNTHLFGFVLISGPSMLPTIDVTGNLVLAERISPRFEKLGVGDIVQLRSPEIPWKSITKRLVAVEGESVSYIVDPKRSDKVETAVVPKGHVWVEGDNMYKSCDSRHFGAVPYGLIHSKVIWRVWPPKDFGSLAQSKRKNLVS